MKQSAQGLEGTGFRDKGCFEAFLVPWPNKNKFSHPQWELYLRKIFPRLCSYHFRQPGPPPIKLFNAFLEMNFTLSKAKAVS
jgi:hypothetical protein